MTYTTTLIIPFRFDCGGSGIENTDALIQQQGIWQRAAYSDQNAVKNIAETLPASTRITRGCRENCMSHAFFR